ncbi:hypothetical protein CCAX7_19170 [Capsulimonas corticalis]|uniref:Transcription factor zinc-finger domain-containing protein n=1 Tax=Capsulimonas corticalis TaxID=2219043 RepID=A0A402D5B0_9BACT|nr:zf-TFIIB domain-containing protein [Capsulimonas corticalis]BDI29866.1 hypothetical protein CCAX7_19170 [Capsulimonas corticalis]
MKSETRFCPVGCGPLKSLKFRGVLLDRCPQCAGVWFDALEYETLGALPEAVLHTLEVAVNLESAPQVVSPHVAAPKVLSCPACHGRLEPVQVTNRVDATLDQCVRCFGYWADDSELALLSSVLEADKPYFAPMLGDGTRREVASALSEALAPHHEVRITLFQSICVWLNRPIGPSAS